MSDLNPKAAEMFAAGESVNAVATALFKGAWAKAKQQYETWRAGGGGEVAGGSEAKPRKGGKRRAKRKAAAPQLEQAAVEDEGEDEAEIYDLKVEVPTARLGDLFAAFTRDEQAYAVQAVLQERMNALVAG